MRQFLMVLLLVLLSPLEALAAEVIPPSPSPHYIVDQAHVLTPPTVQAIDQQLQQFERDTSNQVVVAIYPTMQSQDDLAAYAVRVFQAWHIGRKGKDNGALLLVFIQDHKMNITTGYGLEGALPDATCKQIIEQEIKPRFRAGDYDGGIRAGVNAILAATRGEYKGTGQTWLDQGRRTLQANWVVLVFLGLMALLFISSIIRGIYGTAYSAGGRMPAWAIPFIILGNMSASRSGSRWGGSWGDGGGWSSGGGDGGGFSGGGGSTGGGGASGSW